MKLRYIGIPVLTLIIGFSAGAAAGTVIGSGIIPRVLGDKSEVLSGEELAKMDELNEYIKENYLHDIKKSKIADGVYKGMFESLDDPYSDYMTAEEYLKFKEISSGKFVGIGVVVAPNEDDKIQVVSVIKGGPAEASGVKAGDLILKIDGKIFPGSKLQEAVSIMRGKKGESVDVTFLRTKGKESEIIDKNIVRDEVITPTVESTVLEDNIGYLRIAQFEDETYNEFEQNMNNLRSKNIKSLIIDLRENGGGNVYTATQIIDTIVPKGNIVYTENKKGKKEYIESDANELDIPLVVLVNENTASASEIMTAAIKDYKKGTIIGTKTFGKGVIQVVRGLTDGSAFKLTIAEYFSPKGHEINKKGIEPDINVELNENAEGIGPDFLNDDNQLQKAIEVLKNK